MGSKTCHAVGLHKLQPKLAELVAVGQECETPQDESQPLRGLAGGHSQPVTSGWRRAERSSRYGPEFVQVLGNHNQSLVPISVGLDRGACDAAPRVEWP